MVFVPGQVLTAAELNAVWTPYVLPAATTVSLGGVMVDGTTITVVGGVISAQLAGYLTTAAAAAYQTALGYTAYNATNPAGYITATGAPVQSVAARSGAVVLTHADITDWTAALAAYQTAANVTAMLASYATTASVAALAPVQSVAARTGAVMLAVADVSGAAPLASPAFTGTPSLAAATATTTAASDNSTNVATAAMVQSRFTAVASISTTGGSTTLTAAQYNASVVLVTGALTSAATLVEPTAGEWTVANGTTGSFTLTVKTSAGTGVLVTQGSTDAVMANGTNVVYMDNDLSYGAVIAGATINSTPIGGTTAAAGTFTNLTAATVSGAGFAGFAPLASPTITGTATLPLTIATTVHETRVAMAANNIDLNTGSFFTKTITTATTFTVTNIPAAGTAASVVLELTNAGSAVITWWSGMKWAAATAPTLTAAGVDVLGFYTTDGGTTWKGLLLGKGMA